MKHRRSKYSFKKPEQDMWYLWHFGLINDIGFIKSAFDQHINEWTPDFQAPVLYLKVLFKVPLIV